MRALTAALSAIDEIAEQGDLAPAVSAPEPLALESAGEPIRLPDGRRIYPPRLHGTPVDELACALLVIRARRCSCA
jgi:hypothetical protein